MCGLDENSKSHIFLKYYLKNMELLSINKLKTYNNFDSGNTIKNARIDIDLLTEIEIQELYEDATNIAENDIHKDIAYTFNTYIFSEFSGSKLTIDEGFFIGISSITYTDYDDNLFIINDYTTKADSNIFNIKFNSNITAKTLEVIFFTGFETSKIEKNIKRAIYLIIADINDAERSSYSSNAIKRNDTVDRLLSNHRKYFWKQ
jgi:hypothetical protein